MSYSHPRLQKAWRDKNRERYLANKREWARKWRLRMGMKVISKPNVYSDLIPKQKKDNLCNIKECMEVVSCRGCCEHHYKRCYRLIKSNIITEKKLINMSVLDKPNIGGPRPPHIEKPSKVMMYSDYLKIEKKRRKREKKLFTGVTRQGIVMRYTKKHE